MGKHGAFELNYSSTSTSSSSSIPTRRRSLDRVEATDLFARLTKRLVRILQDRTDDGYVFRTDLRLRPDPGCDAGGDLRSPPRSTTTRAVGQNWERAALIKARACAGDMAAGEAFLEELRPTSGASTSTSRPSPTSIRSSARSTRTRVTATIAVKGHNVKLGRGGIREIEFFVQTQQLIAGGRDPRLRGRETVPMLGELAQTRLDHRARRATSSPSLLVPAPRRAPRCRWCATSRPTRCRKATTGWSASPA